MDSDRIEQQVASVLFQLLQPVAAAAAANVNRQHPLFVSASSACSIAMPDLGVFRLFG